MSMYNIANGVNQICVFMILPMLGKHPDEYPRFRDCFLSEDNQHIHVYTRVGGGNRNSGFGEEVMESHENFISTFDDPDDPTYGTYVFSVPDVWKSDFDKILSGDLKGVSKEYKNRICEIFPSLSKEIFPDA